MNVYLVRLVSAMELAGRAMQCLHSVHAVQTLCEHWSELTNGTPSLSTMFAVYVVAETGTRASGWLCRRYKARHLPSPSQHATDDGEATSADS